MPINEYLLNGTWSDISLTNYPWNIDKRQSEIDEGSIDPATGNIHFKLNINYEERDRLTSANAFTVFANDINVLLDAVTGIQRTVGIMPQGAFDDVAARLTDTEAFVMKGQMIDDHIPANLDERYMWGGPVPPDAALLSIFKHKHSGGDANPSKIELSSEVAGLLGKSNMDLVSGTESMLTAGDMYMSTAMTQKISDAIGGKFDKTGGEISGETNVSGNFSSLTSAEIDAYETLKVVGSNSSDIGCYSGYSRKGISTDPSGLLLEKSIKLRYGKYVAAIRLRVGDNSSLSYLGRITMSDGYASHVVDYIVPNHLRSTDYEMIYIEFDHKNRIGSPGKKDLKIEIDFYTGVTSLDIDSIVIQPVTTAVYDDDSYLI
jgi:hypothetical protein